jgi:sugar lactone lactonase YvrE
VQRKNDHAGGRGRRALALTGAVLLAATVASAAPPGAAADAAPAPAIPVVGVPAFGIGAGQGGPSGVAVDARGDVFDAAGNQVVEYVRGSTRTSYPRHGVVIGGVDGQGSGLRQLDHPDGVALDRRGDLFVSDTGNNRVLEYVYLAARHRYATTGRVVAGTGTAGSGPTQLSNPTGLAIDRSGNLFVGDGNNNRVEEFTYHHATGRYAARASTVAGRGGQGSGRSQLYFPDGIALDARGDLFVADSQNARVMEYAVSSTGSYPANGTVAVGGLPDPSEWVAFDHAGNLFVSYFYINRGGVSEFRYNPATKSFARTGTAVDSRDMLAPTGLAFDASGDLFTGQGGVTVDPWNTVWDLVLELTYHPRAGTFSPTGTILYQMGRQNLGVSAVALDSHGNLFVSDQQVYEFAARPATGTYSVRGTVLAASGGALGLDTRNDLFVANTEGPGVLQYRWRPIARRYARAGVPVPGATQLRGMDVTAVAFDSRNDLFAASGTRVLEFRHHAGGWAASGTVLATVTAGASGPVGLAVDGRGDLFVCDPVAGLVREYLFHGTYAKTGITVAGKHGELSDPTGVAVDRSGHLYVFDAGNARVVKYTGNPATGAYGANGVTIFSTGTDNFPENGGVAVDHSGDAFFGDNLNSAVVYEVAAG